VHPDPNLCLNGIKWQTGVGVRAGEFTVTLISHSAVEVRMVGAKGPDVAWGEIAGPISEQAIQLEAGKTVSPPVAQPGDLLTYTIVSENVGTHWAYGIVLTDPIPAGITYVGASAQATLGYV
jgi:uncharacterized repeat protein (TIGR01451 family)